MSASVCSRVHAHVCSLGLGLFVQGSVPAGGVVAILPGVVYARTQLPRMPNFPKVWARALRAAAGT